MKTEALIRELAARVEPVKPVGHPLASFAAWAAAAAIWIAVAVTAVGVRSDFAAAWRTPAFALGFLLPLALGLAAAAAAFVASIPGHSNRGWPLLPVAFTTLWLLLVVVGALSADHGHVGSGLKCIRNLAAFSVPPGLLLFLMLQRAAPLERGAAGMLATIASAALAHVGTRLVCHSDGALHALVWHCTFVLLLGGVGILVGRRLFR